MNKCDDVGNSIKFSCGEHHFYCKKKFIIENKSFDLHVEVLKLDP